MKLSVGWLACCFLVCALGANPALAIGTLEIKTQTEVSEQGRVGITLTLKNIGSSPIYHLHPMLHFHHTMAMLNSIHRLNPGESVTLKNHDHPPVRLHGSYPLVAMIRYQPNIESVRPISLVHTDSFFFKEARPSEIEGSIVAGGGEESSFLKVNLRNTSTSFKNVRMMLVLPPEIESKTFQKMKGLTLRSGEEKTFDIPLALVNGSPGGQVPVHLLVEYGQMVQHYSGDIVGMINFAPFWGAGPLWPHLLVLLFLSSVLFITVHRRRVDRRQKPTGVSC